MNPRILVFAGSTRTGAYSEMLAAAAATTLSGMGCAVTHVSLADFEMPIYNGDLQQASGIPEATVKLARLFGESDGILIVTPEYNHSLPALLKNTIDWLSRLRGDDRNLVIEKPTAILSSSTGQYGGARALPDLRRVLVSAISAIVIPQQMSLSKAGGAFTDENTLADEGQLKQLATLCRGLMDMAKALGNH